MAHPDIATAAVIGVSHKKWDERPILLAIPKPDREIIDTRILDFLGERIAKWWLPDKILAVESLPMTATGKIDKRKLRDQYQDLLSDSDF